MQLRWGCDGGSFVLSLVPQLSLSRNKIKFDSAASNA